MLAVLVSGGLIKNDLVYSM